MELEESDMAFWTNTGVKGVKEDSRGCFFRRLRVILRQVRLDLWREMEVNCLIKELEMSFDEVKILGPKEMG